MNTSQQLINHYCYGTCKLDKDKMKKDFILSKLKGICHPELIPDKEYCCSVDKSGLDEYVLKNPCCVSYERWETQLQKCCRSLDLSISIEELICKVVIDADIEEVNCGITVNSVVDEVLCDILLKSTVDAKSCGIELEKYINKVVC